MALKTDLLLFWESAFPFGQKEVAAFQAVPREFFVPDQLKDQAYVDQPLPLLRGKTISQPTTVMLMTAALDIQEGERVFEVGTGSGYQSALLGVLAGTQGKVFTFEVIPELLQFAQENLMRTGIKNVDIREGDGSKGLAEEAPFDKIIITAACKDFPDRLIDQLTVGGIIVAPVGNEEEQEMLKGVKREDGTLDITFMGAFRFTPMYGMWGFEV